MLESPESGTISKLESSNISGYLSSLETDIVSKYKSVIDTFFKSGVSYKGGILLGSATSPENTIKDYKINFEDDQKHYKLKFIMSDPSQKTGTITMRGVNNIRFVMEFDFDSGVESDEYGIELVDTISISFPYITVKFKFTEDPEEDLYFIFDSTNGMEWTVEQYLMDETEGSMFNGIMDCSDYVSFLWAAATSDAIIKSKLFNCNTLINNQFENIKFLDKICFRGDFINYVDYKDLLKDLLPGDILIFKQKNMTHCVIVIDPKNQIYAENSGHVLFNLGKYYNGKTNPYPMDIRFNSLKKNSDVYLCRLFN